VTALAWLAGIAATSMLVATLVQRAARRAAQDAEDERTLSWLRALNADQPGP
jgi:hypothetical protein